MSMFVDGDVLVDVGHGRDCSDDVMMLVLVALIAV
jgi:hypothetical protein